MTLPAAQTPNTALKRKTRLTFTAEEYLVEKLEDVERLIRSAGPATIGIRRESILATALGLFHEHLEAQRRHGVGIFTTTEAPTQKRGRKAT